MACSFWDTQRTELLSSPDTTAADADDDDDDDDAQVELVLEPVLGVDRWSNTQRISNLDLDTYSGRHIEQSSWLSVVM